MNDLTEKDFDAHTGQGLVLVDFHAPWCAPCRQMEPFVSAFADEASGVKVCKVDVDDQPGLAARFGVRGLPTLLLLKDGQPADVRTGFQTLQQIRALVGAHG